MDTILQIKCVRDLRNNRKRRAEVEMARLSRLVQVARENVERAGMGLEEARATRKSTEAAFAEQCIGRCVTLQQTMLWRERVQADLRSIEQADVAYREALEAAEVQRQALELAQTAYQALLKKIEKTDHLQSWIEEEAES
jgi:multidrug resistance efflux pump